VPRNHPHWLKAYIRFTRASESPDAFHFWTGVGTIAGALRRRVWIDMRHFQWTPNFYIILVGPPGIVNKSTSIRIGMDLLQEVDGIRFGPQSMTWQSLTQSLEQAIEYVKYFDTSGKEQIVGMSPVTCFVPELGTFLKMEDGALVDVLVSMWDGQLENWGHRTKSSGNIEIKNPWLNLMACTTPSWLEQHFPPSMIGGGLTSRIMFIYGEKKRHLIAYPDAQLPEPDYVAQRAALIEDLKRVSVLSGGYLLSPAARKWGEDWYARLWSARPIDLTDDRYSGYLSRKQTHIHKLAMVLAASQRDKLLIEENDLIEADALLTTIEPDMIKVFESVGVVDESKNIAAILSYVRAYKWVGGTELFNALRNNMTERDFKTALRIAVEQHLVNIETRNGVRGLAIPRSAASAAE
jgi:Protein of unknown function (DUF3987)